MERLETLLGAVSDMVWGPPLLILLFGTHLFLTFRLLLLFPRCHFDFLCLSGVDGRIGLRLCAR